MTKRYREAVEVVEVVEAVEAVEAGEQEVPARFRWRGSTYRVLGVLGHWREDAGYWSGGGVEVPQRDLWRVEARNGTPTPGVYELVHEGEAWRLEKVWD